ncbi:MAG: hypothetical protein AABX29_05075 [Nanoarchaeota archaeon]
MKNKIFIFILLLVLISGCTVQNTDLRKVNFEDSKISDREETSDNQEIKTNIYQEGDVLNIGGKEVTIKKIGINSEIEVIFDGFVKSIFGTKKPIRVGNYELWANKINIDYDAGSTVNLEWSKIELKENEYLFWFGESKEILGKKVTLIEVYSDDFNSILVDVSTKSKSDSLRIHKGESKIFDNLEVTNLKNTERPASNEEYAVIRVKQV